MNVSAVIVTRGDVDLMEILMSIPVGWEIVTWNNGAGKVTTYAPHSRVQTVEEPVPDLAVYGRYAAIARAHGELIYVQDDDCVVSNPGELVDTWRMAADQVELVVANMPEIFRHDFYREHCLVGFGAVFHRDAPQRAFDHLRRANLRDIYGPQDPTETPTFRRTCDVVFTALTPRVLLDLPYRNLPWAAADDRMYRRPEHVSERSQMLSIARKVRDA